MSTTSLPRITPKGTTVTTPVRSPSPPTKSRSSPTVISTPNIYKRCHTINDISVPSVYETYPSRLITNVDPLEYIKIPKRINALKPKSYPNRRTVELETDDPHWHNEKRSQLMQKLKYLQYHSAYQKYPYGSPAEKEIYRRLMREGLKQQMMEQDTQMRIEMIDKIRESEEAVKIDRSNLMEDSEKFSKHFQFLTQYRDANKEMMEERWSKARQDKQDTLRHEKELLRYNPINWSCTLK